MTSKADRTMARGETMHSCCSCCEHAAERIDELRQSLIGGIEGVKAKRDLTKWAEANERLLARAQPTHRDCL